jgi:phosphoribosylformylglycinamidine cyclo-ligase
MDYKKSGVNIDEGNRAVDLIKSHVKKTYTPNVLTSLGNFAGAFRLDKDGYEDPILVSCTDGVGTKLMVAIEHGIFDTVGIDLVAMSVNDLICMGAKPLFFLDYIACHKLIPEQMELIIKGMADACKETGCALIGGEMAEMNDMYKKGDFDLAGFCVGVVDRPKVIDGSTIRDGDFVYGFASSGIHSNGFSLVRKVLTKEVCVQEGINPQSLLTPTKLYVNDVLSLVEKHDISGVAHITGGGLQENIERILPEGVHVSIEQNLIKIPQVFKDIQRIGAIAEEEMFKVFNMGIGMVIISHTELPLQDDFYYLGAVNKGAKGVSLV